MISKPYCDATRYEATLSGAMGYPNDAYLWFLRGTLQPGCPFTGSLGTPARGHAPSRICFSFWRFAATADLI